MKELKTRYQALKTEAIQLMQAGKVDAYLAKLVEVQDVRNQMIQLSAVA